MKTGKIILIIILSIQFFMSKGQENKESIKKTKHELSIVVDDIFTKSSYPIIYPSSYSSYYIDYYTVDSNTPKIGLGYKYHFSKSAIRTKISVGHRNNTTDDKQDQIKFNASSFNVKSLIGYEFHKDISKTQIFYGVDLFIDYYIVKNETTNSAGFTINTLSSKYKNTGFGISPLIGVKYFFNPIISISTEIKLNIESYSGESTHEDSDDPDIEKSEISGINTNFGPLGQISLNIHF